MKYYRRKYGRKSEERFLKGSTKNIFGRVYEDFAANDIKGIAGVEIKLFLAKKVNSNIGEEQEKVQLYTERLITSTKTSETGDFSFIVNEGTYSLSINLDSLPEGKGVTESNYFIEKIDEERIDFIVRDIYSIEIDSRQTQNLHIGEPAIFNPMLKDKYGSRLSARVKCSSDDATRAIDNVIEFKPGNFEGKWTNLSIISGNKIHQFPIEIKMPEAPMIERIDIAYRNGIIDEKSKMLLYVYTMFDKSKITRGERVEDVPIKSGTIIMQEILDYIRRKDADSIVVDTAKRYIESSIPTLDKVHKSPGGFFRIHYTTSGAHAVAKEDTNGSGVPDYIRKVGTTFDEVKNVTCSIRGFREPLTDAGKSGIDVYVYDLDGKYGVTVSSKYYRNETVKPRRASSYICIDNNYASSKGFKLGRDDSMKVTAAHEFFHAVQYAYNIDADKWWKEATATWMEDEIYNSVNDYVQYIGKYFSNPHKSLEEDTYSRVLFVKYLSEKWGGNAIIRRIWETQNKKYRNSISAIDAAIREKYQGESLGSIFDGFTAWNYNPSQYYKEGGEWNQSVSVENMYSSYPVPEKRGLINHLASNYQLFRAENFANDKTLKITIDGLDSIKWGFKMQKRRVSDGKCELTGIISDGSSRAEILIKDFAKNYSEICLIPANLEKEKDRAGYSYSASAF